MAPHSSVPGWLHHLPCYVRGNGVVSPCLHNSVSCHFCFLISFQLVGYGKVLWGPGSSFLVLHCRCHDPIGQNVPGRAALPSSSLIITTIVSGTYLIWRHFNHTTLRRALPDSKILLCSSRSGTWTGWSWNITLSATTSPTTWSWSRSMKELCPGRIRPYPRCCASAILLLSRLLHLCNRCFAVSHVFPSSHSMTLSLCHWRHVRSSLHHPYCLSCSMVASICLPVLAVSGDPPNTGKWTVVRLLLLLLAMRSCPVPCLLLSVTQWPFCARLSWLSSQLSLYPDTLRDERAMTNIARSSLCSLPLILHLVPVHPNWSSANWISWRIRWKSWLLPTCLRSCVANEGTCCPCQAFRVEAMTSLSSSPHLNLARWWRSLTSEEEELASPQPLTVSPSSYWEKLKLTVFVSFVSHL